MIHSPDQILSRILVVDDDLQIGKLVSEFLTKKGYEVFFVDNGTDALGYVKYARPHVVLLDIRMNDIDGIEVLKQILEIDPKISVMMLTALYEENIGRKALQIGAVDYITKPVNFEYLDTTLKLKLSAMLA